MLLKGQNLKSLYHCFSTIYKEEVGADFKFDRGEKGKVKTMFTYVSEAMGLRDVERFDEALEGFDSYVRAKTKEWLGWTHRSRKNYLGFINKREEIEVYIAGLTQKSSPGGNIAGTGGEEEWEAF